jgi:hypothetical protein
VVVAPRRRVTCSGSWSVLTATRLSCRFWLGEQGRRVLFEMSRTSLGDTIFPHTAAPNLVKGRKSAARRYWGARDGAAQRHTSNQHTVALTRHGRRHDRSSAASTPSCIWRRFSICIPGSWSAGRSAPVNDRRLTLKALEMRSSGAALSPGCCITPIAGARTHARTINGISRRAGSRAA